MKQDIIAVLGCFLFVVYADDDVLDTWFSSGLSIFGWPNQVHFDKTLF